MSELLLPDAVYHIYTHANGNENLFRCEENYRYFLAKYAERIYAVVDTYAYCLMPNHLHLMVRVRSEEEIATLSGFRTLTESQKYVSQQFSHLFNGYTQAYNKMYDRRGSLFERPFKRKIVSDENYFTQLIAYIHNNPVHHGFCNNLVDWPHSSFHTYLMDKPTKLNKKYLDEWFGNREALLEFHQKWLSSGNQFELV
jgi:putative transposase